MLLNKWNRVGSVSKDRCPLFLFTSACSPEQNAETKFSSSLFEFFLVGVRNQEIGEENFVEAFVVLEFFRNF